MIKTHHNLPSYNAYDIPLYPVSIALDFEVLKQEISLCRHCVCACNLNSCISGLNEISLAQGLPKSAKKNLLSCTQNYIYKHEKE